MWADDLKKIWFKKLSNHEWLFNNEHEESRLDFLTHVDDKVTLFDKSNQIYYKITTGYIFFGKSESSMVRKSFAKTQLFIEGTWIE